MELDEGLRGNVELTSNTNPFRAIVSRAFISIGHCGDKREMGRESDEDGGRGGDGGGGGDGLL